MLGLPEIGDKVKVWPSPGRLVQDGPRPVDALGGGRWLPKEGRDTVWSSYLLEQYRAGDILLHDPAQPELKAEQPAEKPSKKAKE